jgi:hypothetical protein
VLSVWLHDDGGGAAEVVERLVGPRYAVDSDTLDGTADDLLAALGARLGLALSVVTDAPVLSGPVDLVRTNQGLLRAVCLGCGAASKTYQRAATPVRQWAHAHRCPTEETS